MARYEECDDPERLAAHRCEHGADSVQFWDRGRWRWSGYLTESGFRAGLASTRYRMVFPDDPTPSRPDGLPADAVEVPWFLPEHRAWVVAGSSASSLGAEWECQSFGTWRSMPWNWADWATVVVRQTPPPAPPATEEITPTPATLHELIGRTTVGWLNDPERPDAPVNYYAGTAERWTLFDEDDDDVANGAWGESVTVLREDSDQ